MITYRAPDGANRNNDAGIHQIDQDKSPTMASCSIHIESFTRFFDTPIGLVKIHSSGWKKI